MPSLVDQFVEVWKLFAKGEYDNANKMHRALVDDNLLIEPEQLNQFQLIIKKLNPKLGLELLCRRDPFGKRFRCLKESLSQEQLTILSKPIPGFCTRSLLETLLSTSLSNTINSEDKLLFASSFLALCFNARYTDLADICLNCIMSNADQLNEFDFAEVMQSIGDAIAMRTATRHGHFPWNIEDHSAKEQVISDRTLSIDRCMMIARWLDTVSTDRIASDPWTETRNWRSTVLVGSLELVQAYAAAGEYSKGSKAMDTMLEAIRLGGGDSSLRWEGPTSQLIYYDKHWLNPFDEKLHLNLRCFLLREYLRLQRLLLEPNHLSLSLFENEIRRLSGQESIPKTFPVSQPEASPAAFSRKATSKAMELGDHIVDLIENEHENVLSYIQRRWIRPEGIDSVTVNYMVRGTKAIRFYYISSPIEFTGKLNVKSVKELIDVVNSASGRITVGMKGGHARSSVTL